MTTQAYAETKSAEAPGLWWWLWMEPDDRGRPANALVASTSGRNYWVVPAIEGQWFGSDNEVYASTPGCEFVPMHDRKLFCGGVQLYKIQRTGALPKIVGAGIGTVRMWIPGRNTRLYQWGPVPQGG